MDPRTGIAHDLPELQCTGQRHPSLLRELRRTAHADASDSSADNPHRCRISATCWIIGKHRKPVSICNRAGSIWRVFAAVDLWCTVSTSRRGQPLRPVALPARKLHAAIAAEGIRHAVRSIDCRPGLRAYRPVPLRLHLRHRPNTMFSLAILHETNYNTCNN